MHAITFNALRSAQRPISRRACRIVAGSRCPLSRRKFHRSAVAYQIPDLPPTTDDKEIQPPETSEDVQEGSKDGEEVVAESPGDTEDAVQVRKDGRASLRRSRPTRPRQPEGVPPFNIPDWFFEKNVRCVEDAPALSGSLAVYGTSGLKKTEADNADTNLPAEAERMIADILDCGLAPTKSAKYSMHVDVYKEILSTLRAVLILRPPRNPQSILRPITMLQCPKEGGTYYLDSVVETIASKLGADLVRIDAQDIAQLVGHYLDENLAWSWSRTSLLAYETSREAGKLEEYDNEGNQQDEGEEAEDEDGLAGKLWGSNTANKNLPTTLQKLLGLGQSKSPKISLHVVRAPGTGSNPNTFAPANGQANPFAEFLNRDNAQGKAAVPGGMPDTWDSLKMATAFESLIDAADSKRARTAGNDESVTAQSGDPRNIIIQIREYKELSRLVEGQELVARLRDAVNKKWKSGVNIILVGTTSIEEGESALSKGDIQHLQSDVVEGEKRTIFVSRLHSIAIVFRGRFRAFTCACSSW